MEWPRNTKSPRYSSTFCLSRGSSKEGPHLPTPAIPRFFLCVRHVRYVQAQDLKLSSRRLPIDPGRRLGDEETQRVEHVGVADLLGIEPVDRVYPRNGNLAAVRVRVVLPEFTEKKVRIVVPIYIYTQDEAHI